MKHFLNIKLYADESFYIFPPIVSGLLLDFLYWFHHTYLAKHTRVNIYLKSFSFPIKLFSLYIHSILFYCVNCTIRSRRPPHPHVIYIFHSVLSVCGWRPIWVVVRYHGPHTHIYIVRLNCMVVLLVLLLLLLLFVGDVLVRKATCHWRIQASRTINPKKYTFDRPQLKLCIWIIQFDDN